jgi:rubrerythrin
MKKLLLALVACAAGNLHAATLSADTLKNLNAAYLGESNASARYAAFAEQADKENLPQVAKLFRAASRAEAIHRDNHKAVIVAGGGSLDTTPLETVKPGTTAENLKAAIAGETYERDTMYPQFLAQAKAEEARDAVRTLRFAAEAEAQHAKLYAEALAQLGQNPQTDYFVCPTCGATMPKAPDGKCPTCREPGSKFISIS